MLYKNKHKPRPRGNCDLCNDKARYGVLHQGQWYKVCDIHERQLAGGSAVTKMYHTDEVISDSDMYVSNATQGHISGQT